MRTVVGIQGGDHDIFVFNPLVLHPLLHIVTRIGNITALTHYLIRKITRVFYGKFANASETTDGTTKSAASSITTFTAARNIGTFTALISSLTTDR